MARVVLDMVQNLSVSHLSGGLSMPSKKSNLRFIGCCRPSLTRLHRPLGTQHLVQYQCQWSDGMHSVFEIASILLGVGPF